MANLKKRFKEILEDLDKNIKNKEDLEYIKTQVYNISLLFLDEMDKIAELNLGKLNVMLEREKELARKITNMEKIISNIEKQVFISEESDYEIVCPYCNALFITDMSKLENEEIKCPECGNNIELDWEEECCGHDCGGHCGECEDCNGEEGLDDYDDDEDYDDENEEEDM